ncbi:MAG: ribosome maturation factor RimP [Thermoleophilia bacterium]|nr:ribosome maturation factor RimP [Thermoleophilia bacterium]
MAITADVEKTLAENLPDVEVVDVEAAGGRGNPVLRVFIDHPEGVNHDLCARVTGLLDRYLRDYTVEVSSPGLERRLRKPAHFAGAVGKKIILKTFSPVEGQRNFTGFLISADRETLRLELEGREVLVPLEKVASARLAFDFKKTEKPQRQRRKRRRQR